MGATSERISLWGLQDGEDATREARPIKITDRKPCLHWWGGNEGGTKLEIATSSVSRSLAFLRALLDPRFRWVQGM